jgi:hypothetical protein
MKSLYTTDIAIHFNEDMVKSPLEAAEQWLELSIEVCPSILEVKRLQEDDIGIWKVVEVQKVDMVRYSKAYAPSLRVRPATEEEQEALRGALKI